MAWAGEGRIESDHLEGAALPGDGLRRSDPISHSAFAAAAVAPVRCAASPSPPEQRCPSPEAGGSPPPRDDGDRNLSDCEALPLQRGAATTVAGTDASSFAATEVALPSGVGDGLREQYDVRESIARTLERLLSGESRPPPPAEVALEAPAARLRENGGQEDGH
jgi:hypothetical protein